MLVFISGFGGAGKDTIANKILKRNSDFERLVTYTTREPRKGEVNGVDYNFISEEEFVHKSYQDDWLECRKYNFVGKSDIVRYATPKYQDYSKKYLLWGSVDQAVKVKQRNSDPNMCWIHIEVPPRVRLSRMLERTHSDEQVIEACRRLYQDHLDFKEVEQYFSPNFISENKDGYLDECVEEIESVIGELDESRVFREFISKG